MIVGKKALPANDLKEFVAWLKANPDQATQGTTGAGGISTVGGLFFQRATGTQFRFVPYRVGLAAAMQDLVGGQIDFMIDTAANSLPQVRAGAIKAFAVTSKTRLSQAPDIPTVDEAGLPGLYALELAGRVSPEGRTERRCRQAQCRRRVGAGRCVGAKASGRDRAGDFSARSTDAGGACARSRNPRSRSGGRSSRPPTSRPSDFREGRHDT